MILEILTIILVFGMTFLFFQVLGRPKESLVYTAEEKDKWDRQIGPKLSKWFTATNIVGTLTSLATAYLFFIGNSKIFGWAILACVVSIFFSGFITNFFTKKILSTTRIKELLESKKQKVGVIASLFWNDTNNAKQLSNLVKVISLLNIGAIIWLEFALFTDIFVYLFQIEHIMLKSLVIFLATTLIIYFTVKYGLRGFVFADSFQSPLILFSILLLMTGCGILIYQSQTIQIDLSILSPIVPTTNVILFVLHVFVLNSFLILVTEGHWLRVWIFGENETVLQKKSMFTTSIVWLLLILVGFGTFALTNQTGENSIFALLENLKELSIGFILAFWIGAVSALFSTADTQIYSFFLVRSFNHNNGNLDGDKLKIGRPFLKSLLFASFFTLAYIAVRLIEFPFEKIIFIVMPICLNLLPAFVRLFKGYKPKPSLTVVSIIGYMVLSIIGFFQSDNEMSFTLAASLFPVLISLIALKK
ncbi:hypothetical protein P8625_00400 [Tenacibaculum tangerinum]|uniref:Na+/proline symporter n=1 Tax=Tenacibaculum tangerinum TaxID=3038772 RepID=A0ABY8L2I6_9FLAO|nr:hypothetical protein [Tenacibaculum tangerinum]WGH75657.1 hypothetical protein P8625_00400 [Tenacibaculum tangerinum]